MSALGVVAFLLAAAAAALGAHGLVHCTTSGPVVEQIVWTSASLQMLSLAAQAGYFLFFVCLYRASEPMGEWEQGLMHLLTFATLLSASPPIFLLDVWRRGDASGELRTSDGCRRLTLQGGLACSASSFVVTCVLCAVGHRKAIARRGRALIPNA